MGTISESDVRDNDTPNSIGQEVIEKEVEESSEQEPVYRGKKHSDAMNSVAQKFGDQKRPAVSGLIVLLPITAVVLVVSWLFNKISLLPGHQLLNVTNIYVIDQSLKLGAIIGVGALIVTITGRFVKTEKGFKVEKAADQFFSSIPFLGAIHQITKVTAETVAGSTKELRKPVKLEIQGNRVTAFKTGNTTVDGREIVFLPTSPNITTGMVLEVRPEKIIETNETSEQALIRTLSAGFGQHNEKN